MLMRVKLQSTTQRDPVEQGKALVEWVYVDAAGGDEAAAMAARPGWLIVGVEAAPADYKVEAVAPAAPPAKRGRKAA